MTFNYVCFVGFPTVICRRIILYIIGRRHKGLFLFIALYTVKPKMRNKSLNFSSSRFFIQNVVVADIDLHSVGTLYQGCCILLYPFPFFEFYNSSRISIKFLFNLYTPLAFINYNIMWTNFINIFVNISIIYSTQYSNIPV